MMKTHHGVAALSSAVLLWASHGAALEMKLHVAESNGVARAPAVIASGIPFARGTLKDGESTCAGQGNPG